MSFAIGSINWEEIERIKVKTYTTALSVCHFDNPKTRKQSKYSIPFGIAIALINGDAQEDRFTDDALMSEPIQQLLKKTTVECDPDIDREFPEKWGTMVEIATKAGKMFSRTLDFPKGEPEDPLSKSEIVNKFNHMSSKVLNAKRRRQIIDFIDNLESIENVAAFFPLLEATTKVGSAGFAVK